LPAIIWLSKKFWFYGQKILVLWAKIIFFMGKITGFGGPCQVVLGLALGYFIFVCVFLRGVGHFVGFSLLVGQGKVVLAHSGVLDLAGWGF
jgi:hypothetical protein